MNQNQTWYTVVFCTTDWEINENYTLPCQMYQREEELIFYSLFYNFSLADFGFLKSLAYPIPTDLNLLKLKQDVDNAILTHLGKK